MTGSEVNKLFMLITSSVRIVAGMLFFMERLSMIEYEGAIIESIFLVMV